MQSLSTNGFIAQKRAAVCSAHDEVKLNDTHSDIRHNGRLSFTSQLSALHIDFMGE